MLYSMEESMLNEDFFKYNQTEVCVLIYIVFNVYIHTYLYFKLVGNKDFVKFQLSRSYFNLKEYLRASYYLNECESSGAYFLKIYSKYMVNNMTCKPTYC
jgi:hypothetical protein